MAGRSSTAGLSRRRVLALSGSAAAAAAGSGRAGAQSDITLRWWSPQASPAQLKTYRAQIAAFEAANPGVKVQFEPTSDSSYSAQFAAAAAAKQLPNIITHLPSFAAQTYYAQGLVEPMDDVIEAVGPGNYYARANEVYRTGDGRFCGTGIGNTAADMLWLRRDLMEKAGIDKPPATWDELRAACRKMQGGGIYGAPLPYGLNSMTSLIFIGFIHRGGGQVFTPDLQVAIDSDATRDAIEFYRSMKELCPPGATGYSWGESLTAFVSGATATGIYAGRVLANVTAQNPKIADAVTCVTYPTVSASVPPWTFNDFPSIFLPRGVANLDAAKRFAAFLLRPPGYVDQLLAAPGHILPVLRPIAENPDYLANPIVNKFKAEVSLMAAAAAGGFNLGFESPAHRPNRKANDIIAANVVSELVQRVVVNGQDTKTVLGEAARRLDAIMKA